MKTLSWYLMVLMLALMTSVHGQIPSNGMMAWYPFNGNANDESGHGNNGTVSGAVLTSDRFNAPGKAYSFDGSNDYITCPDSPSLLFSSKLTLSCWVRPAAFVQYGGIVTKGSDSYETFTVSTQNDSKFHFRANWPSNWVDAPTLTKTTGQWYHMVAIFYAGNVTIYVNGQLENTFRWPIATLSNPSGSWLSMGVNHPGSDEYYSGLIDDVRLYNRDLSDTEIQFLYNEQRITLNTPTDNQLNVSFRPEFTWFRYAPGYSYQIQVASDLNFNNLIIDKDSISDTTCLLTGNELAFNSPYYWRVRGIGGTDTTYWSTPRKFTTSHAICYQPLTDTTALGPRYLRNVRIESPGGVDFISFKPRIYYRKSTNIDTLIDNTALTDGWKWTEALSRNGDLYDFFVDPSLLFGGPVTVNTGILYFVVAQDTLEPADVFMYSGIPAAAPASVQLTPQNFPVSGRITTYSILFPHRGSIWNYIWVAESGLGRVIRVNINDGTIGGTYQTTSAGSGDPSRTTVDLEGNVWVGNRAEASVCKIGLLLGGTRCNSDFTPNPAGEYLKPPFDYPANALEKYDRNSDGLIRTSAGILGGQQHVLPWSGGIPGDELVKYVPNLNTYCTNLIHVRHVSIDSLNNVWVGAHTSAEGFVKLNGQTGEAMEVYCNSCGGYGGLVDRNQVLWSSDRDPFGLLRYNTQTHTQECLSAYGSYGLGIDSRGNIWNANWEQSKVRKYRPSGLLVGEYPIGRDARGIAVTPKDDHVWIANSNYASVTRVDSSGNVVKYIATGTTPIGVAVDFNGKVWVINYGSNSMSRINPEISNGVVDLTVNLPSNALPYNYSDMACGVLRTIYPERFKPIPQITGPRIVLNGQTCEYTTTQPAGITSLWRVTGGTIQGDPASANDDHIIVNWGACGAGTVKLIQTNLLLGTSDSLTINVEILLQTPVNYAVPDNAICISLTPQLIWSSVPFATGYQVQLSTSPDFPAGVTTYQGISDTTFTTGTLNYFQTYYWRVRAVTPVCRSDWSSPWKFRTLGTPVAVTITATADTICAGTVRTFSAHSVYGGSAPQFQWRLNRTEIPGATDSVYAYAPEAGDTIDCRLTSGDACPYANPVWSNKKTTFVRPLLTLTSTITASANPVCAGESITFTATAVNKGTHPLYQWYVNGNLIKSSGIPGTGLRAWYPFDGNARDASGNGNNGTVYGAALVVNRFAAPSGAYYFDGSNDYINCGDSPSLLFTNELTVSAWAKPSGYIQYGGLVTKGTDSYETFTLETMNDSKFHFRSNWPGAWYDAMTQAKPTGQWLHIVSVYNRGTVKMFVNGQPESTASWGITSLSNPSGSTLLLGVNHPGNDEYYNGVIDDITLFNRELTTTEIRSLYLEGDSLFSYTPDDGDTVWCQVTSRVPCLQNNTVASNVIIMGVHAIPDTAGVISGPDTVYQGETGVVYSVAPVPGATSYIWTLPPGALIVAGAGSSSITVSFSDTATSGTIQVSPANHCGTGGASQPFPLTVLLAVPPVLPVNNVTITANLEVCFNALETILVAGSAGPVAIEPGGRASFIAGQRIRFLEGFTVALAGFMHGTIAPAGTFCNLPAMVATKQVTQGVPGSESPTPDEETFTVKVFPNPTSGNLTIECPAESGQPCRIGLYDPLGRPLTRKVCDAGQRHTLSLTGLKTGIYLLRISRGNHTRVMKVVKQ